jgi:TusE/DsrC/DsvC family sulfur relay protein
MSKPVQAQDKTYAVDGQGFLLDPAQWDDDFARSVAKDVGIVNGLTKEHWDVIRSVRDAWLTKGRCPSVYETCRTAGLRLKDLIRLFPTGYLRGVCKLAGITYKHGYVSQTSIPKTAEDLNVIAANKTYQADVRGFLIDPDQWDEYYAVFRAYDMKIPGGRLTDGHWQVIRFLREHYRKNREVPTVYETCRAMNLNIDELERLFPDGYHRGAVKVAGLRVL